jgi:hypothetical protein
MDIYWNILTMHGPINVKFPNNTSKSQMEYKSALKGLTCREMGINLRKITVRYDCISKTYWLEIVTQT